MIAEYLITFGFVTLGVLLSVLMEPAMKKLWGDKKRGIATSFRALLPAAQLVGASIVIGGISYILALQAGQDLSNFWVAILWGFGADRIVTMFVNRNK